MSVLPYGEHANDFLGITIVLWSLQHVLMAEYRSWFIGLFDGEKKGEVKYTIFRYYLNIVWYFGATDMQAAASYEGGSVIYSLPAKLG
mmetsp:Transcript_3391/g.6647  ORF Transcript_3391/g.6647 Transcript_3391/m.6647 type:complete len:88 (-) Transcript_3391:2048-2311(-)